MSYPKTLVFHSDRSIEDPARKIISTQYATTMHAMVMYGTTYLWKTEELLIVQTKLCCGGWL